ncbi:MAG: extensin family protein [Myxococcales bacterium]|nr:extensin family protein [Myxococcales bacterium]
MKDPRQSIVCACFCAAALAAVLLVAPSSTVRAQTRVDRDAGPSDARSSQSTANSLTNDGSTVRAIAPDASSPNAAEPSEGADDATAARVLGRADDDLPDPIADEGERTGSAEGEALPTSPQVAHEIAALSDRQCIRVLRRAGVSFEPSERAQRGVAQPIFITGPIGGVTYRASGRRTIRELMDCRLAVALVRWSRMLRALSVREVVHLSTYRPPTESEAARNPVQTRHAGGMAIDAGVFVLDDGTNLSVLGDFHGRLGRPVCGPDARVARHVGARLLRTIACDSARRGFFHVLLTPNFNVPHRNHFHLEVARQTSWQFVR